MKNLILLIVSLGWGLFCVNAQAHGPQTSRNNGFIDISDRHYSPSNQYRHYSSSYYSSDSLIVGINYRNNNSRAALHQRLYRAPVQNSNSHFYRNNSQITYQSAYRSGYRDGRRNAHNEHSVIRHINSNDRRVECYEIEYDRHGNRIRRALPAAACRP